MPRHVDHTHRRNQIVQAAMQIVAAGGLQSLTFRAVAARMGGSTTLVTHYFATQRELLDEVVTQILRVWDEEIRVLDGLSTDPRERLQNLLLWLVPITEAGLVGERSRINLLSGQLLGEENRPAFQAWDLTTREYLRAHLRDLLPAEEVEPTVELLRVVTNGVVLSTVEHTDQWPAERQVKVVQNILDRLGLAVDGPPRSVGELTAVVAAASSEGAAPV